MLQLDSFIRLAKCLQLIFKSFLQVGIVWTAVSNAAFLLIIIFTKTSLLYTLTWEQLISTLLLHLLVLLMNTVTLFESVNTWHISKSSSRWWCYFKLNTHTLQTFALMVQMFACVYGKVGWCPGELTSLAVVTRRCWAQSADASSS